MKIKFTNFFNNYDKSKQESQEIDVDGKCTITNYDPREKQPSLKGDITVNVEDRYYVIKKGTSLFDAEPSSIDFNQKKYSIFKALCGYDQVGKNVSLEDIYNNSSSNDLTLDDLEKAKDSFSDGDSNWEFLKSLGVSGIRFDKKAGVATILIGDKELLRIDFETKKERKADENNKMYGSFDGRKVQEIPAKVHEVMSDKEGPNTIVAEYGMASTVRLIEANPHIDWKLEWKDGKTEIISPKYFKKGTKINIPDLYMIKEGSIKTPEDIAKATGVSLKFVISLMKKEGQEDGSPKLTTYDDGQKCPTIGYGHIGRVDGKLLSLKKPITITNEKALELLAQDILVHKLDDLSYFGEAFEDAPESVQMGILDMTFWRGIQNGFQYVPNSKTNEVKKFLEKEKYGKVVACLEKPCSGKDKRGLMRRNFNMIMEASQDLSKREKLILRKEYQDTYNELEQLFVGSSARDSIIRVWKSFIESY